MAPPVAHIENTGAGLNSSFSLTSCVYSPSKPSQFSFLPILATLPASHTATAGLCVPASLPGPALLPGALPRRPPTSHGSTCAPPSMQPRCVSGSPLTSTFRPLISFPFSSVNSKHLFRKQGPPGPGYHCLSHLFSPTLFFSAGFAKQQSFKRLHFSLPIFKKLW